MSERKQYEFKGSAVRVIFDKEVEIARNLSLRTWATSEAQALNNINFQVKSSCNLERFVKVKLYGDLHEVK